jgi:hypothetical protein
MSPSDASGGGHRGTPDGFPIGPTPARGQRHADETKTSLHEILDEVGPEWLKKQRREAIEAAARVPEPREELQTFPQLTPPELPPPSPRPASPTLAFETSAFTPTGALSEDGVLAARLASLGTEVPPLPGAPQPPVGQAPLAPPAPPIPPPFPPPRSQRFGPPPSRPPPPPVAPVPGSVAAMLGLPPPSPATPFEHTWKGPPSSVGPPVSNWAPNAHLDPDASRMPVRAPNPVADMIERRHEEQRKERIAERAKEKEPAEEKAPPVRALELLWHDEQRVEDVKSSFADLCPAPPPPPRRTVPGRGERLVQDEPVGESPELPSRAAVSGVIRRGTPTPLGDLTSLLERRLLESAELSPPMAVIEARLVMAFDLRRELEQLVATARPLAKHQKKVAEAIGHAEEMLATPVEASPTIARAVGDQLRRAWRECNRMLPADHLDNTVERALLCARAYDSRQVLDATFLRGLAREGGGDAPKPGDPPRREIPTYLPESISKRLPLFRQLNVKMVADVLPRQDGEEASHVCLRVVALARALGEETV